MITVDAGMQQLCIILATSNYNPQYLLITDIKLHHNQVKILTVKQKSSLLYYNKYTHPLYN